MPTTHKTNETITLTLTKEQAHLVEVACDEYRHELYRGYEETGHERNILIDIERVLAAFVAGS